jgi:hypothetical protein
MLVYQKPGHSGSGRATIVFRARRPEHIMFLIKVLMVDL